MRKIDHLVYIVPNLEKAMQYLTSLLGTAVVYGGQHKSEGTHNALVNLGNGTYLELLAVDKSNLEVTNNRWMGIDLLDQAKLSRWAIKSNNLEKDAAILKAAHPQMGRIKAGSRKKTDGTILSWALAMPLAEPMVEVLPFAVDWKDSVHPTESLPEVCRLMELRAMHPAPDTIAPILEDLGVDIFLEQGSEVRLQMVIDTPNGNLVL